MVIMWTAGEFSRTIWPLLLEKVPYQLDLSSLHAACIAAFKVCCVCMVTMIFRRLGKTDTISILIHRMLVLLTAVTAAFLLFQCPRHPISCNSPKRHLQLQVELLICHHPPWAGKLKIHWWEPVDILWYLSKGKE